MWLPTPIYERIPQFYFLVGLLFIANALYISFEFTVSFYYIAFGLASCSYGAGLFVRRLNHRKNIPSVAGGVPAVNAAQAAPEAPAVDEEQSSMHDAQPTE